MKKLFKSKKTDSQKVMEETLIAVEEAKEELKLIRKLMERKAGVYHYPPVTKKRGENK